MSLTQTYSEVHESNAVQRAGLQSKGIIPQRANQSSLLLLQKASVSDVFSGCMFQWQQQSLKLVRICSSVLQISLYASGQRSGALSAHRFGKV